ncbi:MAG: acetate--CoA ligase family protein [Acidobacteria bacterium]|nr:acetate--CoA ligase family protein [Acidobacteriota bacterium]
MSFNYKLADDILKSAWGEGRNQLTEPEAYEFLAAFGIEGVNKIYIKRGESLSDDIGNKFKGEKVVVKIVSPLVLHKTDVGGVKFPTNNAKDIKVVVDEMISGVPDRFTKWLSEKPNLTPKELKGKKDDEISKIIAESIKGVIISEFVTYNTGMFGHEVLVGLQHSREFGPVVTYGAGGVDTEFWAENFKERKAVTTYSAEMLTNESIEKMIKIPSVYKKLAGKTRDKKKLVDDKDITALIIGFAEIGKRYTPANPDAEFFIEEMEVNPFAVSDGKMIVIDALCRFSPVKKNDIPPKPVEKIMNLLKPESIAIIGVSQKMNIGHIILNNIIKNGFNKDRLYVIKDGEKEIEGIKCYPNLSELPEKVDLFIYTLPATALPEINRELLEKDIAKSVILISGGMGETKSGKHLEEEVENLIFKYRREGKPTPVYNGGNCMGLRSIPGKYDTLFIPEYKMDLRPEGGQQNLAYFSQSGAFMICRLSKLKSINPIYSITTGNQMDLSITDYVEMLADDQDIKVFAIYIEGFEDMAGLRLAKAAKKIIDSGRYVVVYKAGRTSAGQTATSGHTSSIAGDYSVCKGVLEKIGVIMPHNFDEFENVIKFLSFLYDKKVKGTRVGLVSNAGFESVGMADNLEGDNSKLELATFSPETNEKLRKALAILGIDKIQEVHNPLDITPMASDEIYDLCLRGILEEENVDFGMIAIVPLTWQMKTLPKGAGPGEDLMDPDSIAQRLIKVKQEYDKPFVASVDSGKEYDPLVEMLEAGGIPVFRTADSAIRMIRKFTFHKTRKDNIW